MSFEKNLGEASERAKKIKLFVHDIHGVLTPNVVYCDQEGNRRHEFWHMDGFGDLSLNMNGVTPIYLDTTSIDDEGLYRAKELKLDKHYYRSTPEEKIAKLAEIMDSHGVSPEEVAYVGCEITDLKIMQKAGFAAATADAVDEVKEAAHYVTQAPGGRGAIRELCEFILKAKGLWDGWVQKVVKMGYK